MLRSVTFWSFDRIAKNGLFLVVAALASACARSDDARRKAKPTPTTSTAPSAAVVAAPPSGSAAPVAPACPEGMALVPGGSFWVGSDPKEHFSEDESPRFRTELAPFCMDETEVTVTAYAACVAAGACEAAHTKRANCNANREGRGQHPINCVTWHQADAYCRFEKQRLPSEAEWEYVARGGRELKYPWGEASPDDRACWKHNGTCAVRSYPAGAFGLYDVSGNVWEWLSDWYGPYPWPPEEAFARAYRGGSFSRRFEKWMHTRLRNRQPPHEWGSHLGFRCAATPAGTKCPFGVDAAGRCMAGVLERSCPEEKAWNGVRCARPSEPRCALGRVERPGHGCVLGEPEDAAAPDLEAEMAGVEASRSTEFDDDCRTNFRDRPKAFRYFGGTHRGRNLVSQKAGCKNRDVGVGWNSTCCP